MTKAFKPSVPCKLLRRATVMLVNAADVIWVLGDYRRGIPMFRWESKAIHAGIVRTGMLSLAKLECTVCMHVC